MRLTFEQYCGKVRSRLLIFGGEHLPDELTLLQNYTACVPAEDLAMALRDQELKSEVNHVRN